MRGKQGAGRRSRQGQSLIEYALMAPLFFLLLIGLIEMALLFFAHVTIASSAREGARAGIVRPFDSARVEAVVRDRTLGLRDEAMSVTVRYSPAAEPEVVYVTVRYDHTFITGLLFGDRSIGLQATTSMNTE